MEKNKITGNDIYISLCNYYILQLDSVVETQADLADMYQNLETEKGKKKSKPETLSNGEITFAQTWSK